MSYSIPIWFAMVRTVLKDKQWDRIKDTLPGKVSGPGPTADKGYDSDAFLLEIKKSGAEPVIPPKRNRVDQRNYDKEIYKERNLVERLFQKFKNFRRVATRYERLARNYMGMLQIATIMIWLA